MGKITGFLEFERNDRDYAPVEDRVKGYREFVIPLGDEETRNQAARCMDCGVPYCHGTNRITGAPTGCPVNNQIPDWNDLVYRGEWDEAARNLHSTNNFPEVTGRICPAPCEASCTLNIDDNPVTIKTIECAIADRAIEQGLKPEIAAHKTGRKVAVVGAGPAGMACAQQLARAGHDVHLFEKNAKAGGLLRYGIPDFKMEKDVIDRRLALMREEGTRFHSGVEVGTDVSGVELRARYDAVVLAVGSTVPRDLDVPGRQVSGVLQAMEYLPPANRAALGEEVPGQVTATGKDVVVIGGGDTGADCLGTAIRQGARSVTQLEIMPRPSQDRPAGQPWPTYPNLFRVASAHEEGGERVYAVSTQEVLADGQGAVRALRLVDVELVDGRIAPVPGTERDLPAQLVLLAMGFTGPEQSPLLEQLGVTLTGRGTLARDDEFATDVPGVFVAGDAGRGQSLIVWAIAEGRAAARAVDAYLSGTGTSELPAPIRASTASLRL